MATTVQIIVAGLLLLAWIWVLGRPSAPRGASAVSTDDEPGSSRRLELPHRDHDRMALAHRRRQRLLGTIFATFAAFFLAIAFRGPFVGLFLLMVGALTIHLGIASHVGGRLVAEERAVRVAAAKAEARRRARGDTGLFGSGPLIGAGRARDLALPSGPIDVGPPPSGISSPGDTLENLSGPPAHQLVSELIDQAWATVEGTAADAGQLTADEGPDGSAPATASPTVEGEAASVPATGAEEGVRFARPSGRGRFRRRKVTVITIEGQFDDDVKAAAGTS